jgi:energy-coupling factor transporter transmembrane protein EcfT
MLVSIATLTTLERWDWHEGLARIPMPRLLRALLAQIVHQTGHLAGETQRIAAAMAVRGAAGRWRVAFGILVALPRVWLPRVLDRADRTAAAMDLRGLGVELPRFRSIDRTWRDAMALAGSAGWLVVAFVQRSELVL